MGLSNSVAQARIIFYYFSLIVSYICLPGDNLINDCLLLKTTFPEVDSSCLNALMPHQIGQQRDVVILFQKILCKAMSE